MLWEVDCSSDQPKAPISIVKVATIKDAMHLVVVRDDSTIEVHRFMGSQNSIGQVE